MTWHSIKPWIHSQAVKRTTDDLFNSLLGMTLTRDRSLFVDVWKGFPLQVEERSTTCAALISRYNATEADARLNVKFAHSDCDDQKCNMP